MTGRAVRTVQHRMGGVRNWYKLLWSIHAMPF